MKKVYMNIPLEYVRGHLRYGHLEGIVELTDEEYNNFITTPNDFIKNNDLFSELDFLIDDYSIEGYEVSPITSDCYKIIDK